MDAAELLKAHFRTIKVDPQAWLALFAPDVVVELPFAPPHIPRTLKGVDAISESIGGFLSQLGDDFKVHVKKIYRIEGEDAAIAEFSLAVTVVPTGKVYSQDYILYLRAENGKIAMYREYFDGSRVVAAFASDKRASE